jgi:hypothetical protein
MEYYRIEWKDNDGQFHTDFFVNPADPRWKTYNVSYVEKWTNPEEGVRKFLSNLLLNYVVIDKHE